MPVWERASSQGPPGPFTRSRESHERRAGNIPTRDRDRPPLPPCGTRELPTFFPMSFLRRNSRASNM